MKITSWKLSQKVIIVKARLVSEQLQKLGNPIDSADVRKKYKLQKKYNHYKWKLGQSRPDGTICKDIRKKDVILQKVDSGDVYTV